MTWPDTSAVLNIRVRLALGADRTADPSTWTWTDISAYARDSARAAVISQGAADEWASAPPSTLTLTLDNRDGRFDRRNPTSPYYGQLADYTPIEIAVDPDGAGWRVRYVGEIVEWPRSWDLSGADATVAIRAAGLLRRIGQGDEPLRSAPARWLPGNSPLAAWTLEDTPAAVAGSPLVGRVPMWGFRGTHPSGAVITSPQWGQGRLGSWLPPVLSRSGAAGLTVLIGWVFAPAATSWTVDYMYASDDGAGVSTVDVNPAYLLGGAGGWPQLILTPSVRGVDVAMGGEPEVLGTEDRLFDGRPHHIRWTGRQAGSQVSWSVWVDGRLVNSGTTSGALTLPTLTAIGLSAEAQAGVAVAQGYVAAWTTSPPPLQLAVAAALGHVGEPAGRRIERLCDEESIRLQVVDPYRVGDDFDRSVSAGWGSATTGEAWSVQGGTAADFGVAAGQGTIEQPTAEVLRAVVLADPEQVNRFDVRVLVEVPAVASGGSVGMHAGIVARWTSDSSHVRAQLRFAPAGGITLGWVTPGGAGTAIGAVATIAASYSGGDRYWLRAVGDRGVFRARAWAEGAAEPHEWQAWGESDTHRSGIVGVFARRGVGDTTTGPTFAFESVTSRSILDETEPMGPQGVDTLLQLLRNAEDADQGRLQDAPTALALQYIARRRRYNLPADLDLVAGDLGGVPQIQDDDQRRYSRVVSTGPTGAVVEVRDEAAIARAGGLVVTSPITPPVATDRQATRAAWWHLASGTVDRDRYPQLPLNFARSPELIDDWLAVVPGRSRLRIAGGGSLGVDPVEQIVEGWTETISQTGWRVSLLCSPADVWTVGVLGSTTRPDTAGSVTTAEFVAGTDTSLSVERAPGVRQLWTVRPADFPLDLLVSGVRLIASACSGSSDPQTFTVDQQPVNGVVKTIPAGTPVRLADPWRLAR